MSNVTLIFAIACLCVAVQAQTGRPRDREICANENSRCERNQRRLGRDNDVSNVFNNHCRQSNRGWRNISHCELTLATCRLTLENCSIINCANVRRSLAGGTTGRPTPSSRTTTPRIPSPQTTRRGPVTRTPSPRTTRRGPATRTPSPQTTRRGPVTRTPAPRTTRRGPATRTPSPRRTTTRRPLED